MPFIPVGYGQATVNFAGANVPHGAAIVVGFANVIAQDADTCAAVILGNFSVAVPNMCTSDVSLISVDVKLGDNETGPIGSAAGAAVPGAAGSTSLSPGTAVLVEKLTPMGGRRGKGRMYWPGVYEGWVDDSGGYVGGVLAQLQAFMDTLFDDMETSDTPFFLLHSPSYSWVLLNGRPRRVYEELDTAGEPTGCTSLLVDPIIATQRRRLR